MIDIHAYILYINVYVYLNNTCAKFDAYKFGQATFAKWNHARRGWSRDFRVCEEGVLGEWIHWIAQCVLSRCFLSIFSMQVWYVDTDRRDKRRKTAQNDKIIILK